MDIDYSFTRSIPPDDLLALFAENVWTKDRTRADVQLMLEKSGWVGAWRGNQLVGFARAVTDDLYRAFIEDVMVLESARGQGIGLALVRALLGRLAHVQAIALDCANNLAGYYAQLGFVKVDQTCMHIWKGFDWAH